MFLILVGTIAAILFILWWTMKPFYWSEKGVPYFLPLPILGSVWGLAFDSFHSYWNKKYKEVSKLGGIVGFHNFNTVSLVVADVEALKQMVQKSEFFTSRGTHTNPEYDTMAKNIFFASGEEWKRTRSKISPLFSPNRLKSMSHQMSVNMKEFTNQIETSALSNTIIDVNDLSLKLSVDVVVNAIFGITPDSFTNPDSFFFNLQNELFGHNFVLRILLGAISPFIYDLFHVTVFPPKISLTLTSFIKDVIEQRKKNIDVRQDLVQGMLDIVKKESTYDNGPKFSEEDCVSQLMGLYLGGTETTGNSISYLLYELALHQDIQEKTRKEIIAALESEGGIFTYDVISHLTYTNMVINESLRKYPIVPVVTRKCTRATNLSGIDIEEGTGIIVPLMAIHRDPKYYPEPDKFIPERFIKDKNNQNFVFMPFGFGPRICIGMKMANIELNYVLCEVLPRYRILPSHKTTKQIQFSWKTTLNPAGGIWLKFEKL